MTEIFVSLDNAEFIKLDLHSDEAINMKYTVKDLQDISKIFAPYSQSFTFPCTPRNRGAFGFFGDTDVIKINTTNKFSCKIYTDGVLNLTGFIMLTNVSYSFGKPTDFTGEFGTSMTNLKDQIGDTLIGELGSLEIDWTPRKAYDLAKGLVSSTVDGLRLSYFTPLVSTNRVWNFDSNIAAPIKDNIAWDSTVLPNSSGTVKSNELRPALSYSTIIDLIRNKYGLSVILPLEQRSEYKDLFIWCNGSVMNNNLDKLMTVKNSFGSLNWRDFKNESGIPDPKKYTPSVNTSTNVFTVSKMASPFTNEGEYNNFFTLKIDLSGVISSGDSDNNNITFKILRVGDASPILAKTIDVNSDTLTASIDIPDTFFTSNTINFKVYIQANTPVMWTNCQYEINFRYYDGKTGWLSSKEYATYYYQIPINDNSVDIGAFKIDLVKSLPKMKVIDFLQSFFKIFNISVFDTSPNNDNLFWLTPEDIITIGKEYSKLEVDYTEYADPKEVRKSVPSQYNSYNFTTPESKFFSNANYKIQTGLNFGQAKYPTTPLKDAKEFKVESSFSIPIIVDIPGTSEGTYTTPFIPGGFLSSTIHVDKVFTFYGFNSDAPTYTDSGEARYKPNFDEPIIFYNHGSTQMLKDIGFQAHNNSGVLSNLPLSTYLKVMPFNKANKSLAFSTIRFANVDYLESIYKRYYKTQTERLLNPNVLSHEFSLKLPSSEIYLNDATTGQGNGNTPLGFRLQNDVVISENRFSIIDATIDITTGKTKMTLLNY